MVNRLLAKHDQGEQCERHKQRPRYASYRLEIDSGRKLSDALSDLRCEYDGVRAGEIANTRSAVGCGAACLAVLRMKTDTIAELGNTAGNLRCDLG